MGKRSRNKRDKGHFSPAEELYLQQIAEDLLEEVKRDKLEWFSVSMAEDFGEMRFRGLFIVKARGTAEATLLLRHLRWYEPGCCTLADHIPAGTMELIPESFRWRKLTEKEAIGLQIFTRFGESE